MIVENGGRTQTVESCYTLPLNVPHKITLEQNGKTLKFQLDDALQGCFAMSEPFGEIVSAEGVEGVVLSAPESIPAAEETKQLADTAVRPVEQPLWDLADAQRSSDGVRRGVCLNGYWRVIPVNDYSYAPPQESGDICAFRAVSVHRSFRSTAIRTGNWFPQTGSGTTGS